jgi:hypothetical protein
VPRSSSVISKWLHDLLLSSADSPCFKVLRFGIEFGMFLSPT